MNGTPIGTCTDFEGFRQILRKRREQLQISSDRLDDLAGLASGHSSKLLRDERPAKNLGILTFSVIMQALGLRIVVVEDLEQTARLASRWVKRREENVRPLKPKDPVQVYKTEFAKSGAKALNSSLTPEQRRESARNAVRARWRKNRSESANAA